PPEGTVGAAPLRAPVVLAAFRCGSPLVSSFDAEALAVSVALASLGCSGFGRGAPAALCPGFAAAVRFDFEVDVSEAWLALAAACWSFLLAPKSLLKEPPTPPELAGAAEATCTVELGAGTSLDSAEARLITVALPMLAPAVSRSAGGLT